MAYVYGHYTADTNKLFYIGKGIGKRAWSTRGRNSYWTRVANKHGYKVEILFDNLSEEDAFAKEKELINEVGLDNLTNLAEGGKGFTSEEAKKLSKDPEWRRKVTEANRKRGENPAYREKMKTAILQKFQDPTYYNNVVKANRLLTQDPEWRRKNKEIAQQRAKDPEWLRKRTEISRRQGQDPEYRKKRKAISQRLAQDPEWRRKTIESQDKYKREATLVSPTGEIVHVRGINEFARTHGLLNTCLSQLIKGKQAHHRGWRLYNPDHPINQFIEDTSQ